MRILKEILSVLIIIAAALPLSARTPRNRYHTTPPEIIKHIPGAKDKSDSDKEKIDSEGLTPFDFIFHEDTGVPEFIVLGNDTIRFDDRNRELRLSPKDYEEVAQELGVEVPAIKAVVEIEAGKSHQGFWAPGMPILNFDLAMFRSFAKRHGIALGKYNKSHSIVFSRPNVSRYGNQQAAVRARFDAASKIDKKTAIFGSFWGMFQIGGFNWKKCGAESPDEFVYLMSRSERDQLELFAEFLKSTGLDNYLRNKNWSAFARGYNGPSYASRGYHTRLARAYAKYTREEKAAQTQEQPQIQPLVRG